MKKTIVFDKVQNLESLCQDTCRFLWNHPETGGNEAQSASYVRNILEQEGFRITGNDNLPHAFCAEFGSGKPVIAVLGEYDALPGLSQEVCAVKKPVKAGEPGHGCGHNLLGAAALTGAIAIKRFLESEKMTGTVRFYGCPEEELLCGKVKMSYYHMFDGCDAGISWHPQTFNAAHDSAFLASASAKFYFKGITAHASSAPDKGRSAWDAVELMNVGCNYLREHVTEKARIHYSVNSNNFVPNVVPDKANNWYYVRAPKMADVKDIMERIKRIAQGAALMTDTQLTADVEYGCCELKANRKYADLTHKNLIEAEPPVFTAEEKAFAKELQASLDPAMVARMDRLHGTKGSPLHEEVASRDFWLRKPMTASSDSGDVSYIMPLNVFTAACWPVGCMPHTWQATAADGMGIGEKGALYAARVIAGVAYDLYTRPEVLAGIREEFEQTNDGTYRPMYGNN